MSKRKCKIAKPKFRRDLVNRFGKRLFAGQLSNIPDKFFNAIEHPLLRPLRNAAAKRSKAFAPQASFPP